MERIMDNIRIEIGNNSSDEDKTNELEYSEHINKLTDVVIASLNGSKIKSDDIMDKE